MPTPLHLLQNWQLLALTASLGSLSAAAHELGITISVASKRMTELENALGYSVLNRKVRPITLSEQGWKLIPHIQALSQSFSNLHQHLNVSPLEPTSLRISIPLNLSRTPYLVAIGEFRRQHPTVSIQIVLDTTPDDLISGKVDFSYYGVSQIPSGVYAEKLPVNANFLMASRSYLNRYGAPSRIEDLKAHQLLTHLPQRNGCWLQLENGNERFDLNVSDNYRVLHEDALSNKSRLVSGEGIALDLVPHFVHHELATGSVVPVLKGWHKTWHPCVACLKGRENEPHLRSLFELFQTAYQKISLEHWTFWYKRFQIPLSSVSEWVD